MRADERIDGVRDMKKAIVAFRNFLNAPQNTQKERRIQNFVTEISIGFDRLIFLKPDGI